MEARAAKKLSSSEEMGVMRMGSFRDNLFWVRVPEAYARCHTHNHAQQMGTYQSDVNKNPRH